MRDSFGRALVRACQADPDLFVLDADCAHSTRSGWVGERLPASFRNVGIAEQNMVGMAAGLALAGRRPVVSGFASIVVARAAEQILLSVALPGLPVVIAGHYAGMSGALEGAPHHAITDLAFLRAVPGMAVWVPADDTDADQLGTEILRGTGPRYIRLCRDSVPALTGGPRVAGDIRRWDRPEPVVALLGCGVAVGECVRAAEELTSAGITTTALGMLRLKPFPTAETLALVRGCRLVVTVEEHTTVGGLGGAVAEALAGPGPRLVRLGIADRFTETGPYRQLLTRYGITSSAIATVVRRELADQPERD